MLLLGLALASGMGAMVSLGMPTTARAQDPDTDMRMLASLQGRWTGNLEYLDLSTQRRHQIPCQLDARLSGDSAFLFLDMVFTDPNFQVYVSDVTTIDPDTGQILSSFFRDRKVEHFVYDILERKVNGPGDWQIIYETQTTEDDRPAMLRYTRGLKDGELRSRKDVRFLDVDGSEFFFRNRLVLTRVVDEEGSAGIDDSVEPNENDIESVPGQDGV